MIVIDTNVVSEAMHPNGNPQVKIWFISQSIRALYLTTPNVAELLVGFAILPDGKRKTELSQRMQKFVDKHFADRILSFDRLAAEAFARLVAKARASGHTVLPFDGQIAAIASVHRFTVATRDTPPFQACGLPVINPWEPTGAPTL